MGIASSSFTATGNGNTLRVAPGGSVAYAVTGSASATLQIERLVNGSAAAAQVIVPSLAASGNPSGTFKNDTLEWQTYRFSCQAFTSGTAATTLSDVSTRAVSLTAATALDPNTHANKSLLLNAAAGQAITLPPATGSGDVYNFHVGTTITSNTSTIKVQNATDVINGLCVQSQDGGATVQAFEAAASDDTITMDGSTRGGIRGDYIRLIDAAAGVWLCTMIAAGTGSEATPFSATVS